jgi:hypothetical protein
MAEYQLTATDSVIRTEDGACIPADPANRDYAEYLQWVEDGGEPDPYQEPTPPEQQPTQEQALLFEHENRILALEGQPPLTQEDFVSSLTKTTPKPEQHKSGKEPLPRPKSRGR